LSSDKRADEVLDKVILEIKAMVLLEPSDSELRGRVQEKLVQSHDESLRRFVRAVHGGGARETGRSLVVALGELVMASLLVLAGTVVLLPTLSGISTPSALVKYFSEQVLGPIGTSPIAPYLPLVEFVLGAILMVSAFYTLRQAALVLKEAGLVIEPGET